MSEWWMPALAAATALACLAAVLVLVRAHRRTRSELREALREQRDLRARLERLDAVGARGSAAPPELPEYVITDAGDAPAGPEDSDRAPGRMEGRLFADIVLRETLVKAASWGFGVRRALSPEQRNRLRFEVRRETRRTARQRRADTKEALRQYYARERGDVA